MTSVQWADVDHFLMSHLLENDPVLERVLEASVQAGLPSIQVAPSQGKLLNLLARMIGAKRILEVGTLGGYSAIWMARALAEGGRLITLELDEKHADLAEANFALAGVSHLVTVKRGPAIRSLEQLERDGVADFDLVFVDADKQMCAEYFRWAARHTRSRGVIVIDNVVRGGAISDLTSIDESVVGVRRFLTEARAQRIVDFTAIQTVGVKGYDGHAIGLVTGKVR